jgi:hypothetical protein
MFMPIVISASVITEASSNSYYLETGKTMKHMHDAAVQKDNGVCLMH